MNNLDKKQGRISRHTLYISICMQSVKNLIDTYMQSTISQIHQGIKSINHEFQVSGKETDENYREKGNRGEERMGEIK